MAFYLVDYENVTTDGLQGIDWRTSADEIIIFYSEHADRLSFDLHQRINESKAQITYIKVAACKKNALDFQLVTYLGYLIARHPNDSFYIISKDNGFQNVVNFWADRNVTVTQLGALDELPQVSKEPKQPKKEKAQSSPKKDKLQSQVEKIFADSETSALVVDCLRRSKSKQELHNNLAAAFRTDDVGAYYKQVKQLL